MPRWNILFTRSLLKGILLMESRFFRSRYIDTNETKVLAWNLVKSFFSVNPSVSKSAASRLWKQALMGCNKDDSIPIVFLYTIYLLFFYWRFNSSLRRNTIEFLWTWPPIVRLKVLVPLEWVLVKLKVSVSIKLVLHPTKEFWSYTQWSYAQR